MSDADAEDLPFFFSSSAEIAFVKAPHGFGVFPIKEPLETPVRVPIESVPGRRRPTIAVVDTGVANHEWFPTSDEHDAILVDATKEVWTGPRVIDPAYTWHGTFVAGLIRQNAPNAQILSVQLKRNDANGGILDGQILEALNWLQKRTAPDPCRDFVDVICLAIGYRTEPRDGYTRDIEGVIRKLCGRGILIVLAAGNQEDPLAIPDLSEVFGKEKPESDDPVFPAALAKDGLMDGLPFVPVGANKPSDPEVPPFSPEVPWVKHREDGYHVKSTIPTDDGWRTELIAKTAMPDLAADLVDLTPPTDVFARGFGYATGTSFAAAIFAGKMATAMLNDSAGSGVADTGRTAAIERTKRVLRAAGLDA